MGPLLRKIAVWSVVLGLLLAIPATPRAQADYDIPDGHFFTQTGGGGDRGYSVTDEGGVRFWSEFQRLGGVQAVGYPVSRRFQWNGFTVQAMQRAVFQWRPELGQVYFANVFDLLSEAGKDDWLFVVRQTPRPLPSSFDAGKDWDGIMQARLALLDDNPAIKRQYYSVVGDPVTMNGLPTSHVTDMGNNYTLRAQRVVIQQWKEDVPWAAAGQVTVALGGSIAAAAGLLPTAVLQPEEVAGAPAAAGTPSPSVVTPLAAWWRPVWSEAGTDLSISYTRGAGNYSQRTTVETGYDPYGVAVSGTEVTERKGEDIYGREQNVTFAVLRGWRGSLKPDTLVASGTITYPVRADFEQSWFARRHKVTVTSEFDSSGRLTGGQAKNDFSGHLLTSSGRITYSGTVTGAFMTQYGELVWTQSTETTDYSHDGKPYARTVRVTTPESRILGGAFVEVRRVEKTTTTYADGARRESEIVIVSERNASGVLTGMNGRGVVIGSDLIDGKPVGYSGSITVDYSFIAGRFGWIKVGYGENRSAGSALTKRLPFEVVFIGDYDLRPVF